MTTRGLWKSTAYWNNVEARKDWNVLADELVAQGYGELVAQHKPPDDAGWRKIDKAIAALKAAVAKEQP
jgi:hypothetical protein